MKTKLLLTLVLTFISCFATFALGNGQPIQTYLTPKPVMPQVDPEHEEGEKIEHRLPSRPIPCTISETGITFNMECEPEILSYEIADADGMVIAAFGDETNFIQTLFSLTGEYTVSFTSADYVYTGIINL